MGKRGIRGLTQSLHCSVLQIFPFNPVNSNTTCCVLPSHFIVAASRRLQSCEIFPDRIVLI